MAMNILRSQASNYTSIADEDIEVYKKRHTLWSLAQAGRCLLILLVAILTICGWIYSMSKSNACKEGAIRKEWRALTTPEKHEYLAAVQCLKTQPSRLGLNHTLYDDFPFVHSHVGEYGKI
jgi:tyrosinase